jgi:hypothetical protein
MKKVNHSVLLVYYSVFLVYHLVFLFFFKFSKKKLSRQTQILLTEDDSLELDIL